MVNRYFEPTPLACFTGIVTEDGALSITEAARRAEEASIDNALVRALGIIARRDQMTARIIRSGENRRPSVELL